MPPSDRVVPHIRALLPLLLFLLHRITAVAVAVTIIVIIVVAHHCVIVVIVIIVAVLPATDTDVRIIAVDKRRV